jgi:hypothetical protein
MKQQGWSPEELEVKELAEKVGMSLVKVIIGNKHAKYTRFKLRFLDGSIVHDETFDFEKDKWAGDSRVSLLMLDQAREWVENQIEMLEWEPTDAEFEEMLAYMDTPKELREEAREWLERCLEPDKKGCLSMLLKIARGRAAMIKERTCQ